MNDFEPKRTYSLTAAEKRDAGKAYFYNDDSTCDERKYGLQLLLEAQRQGDPEAKYIVACLIIKEVLPVSQPDCAIEFALGLMAQSAARGYSVARDFLNIYCEDNYRAAFGDDVRDGAELVDFNGKPIKLSRNGKYHPVEVELTYKNGQNVLTIKPKLRLIFTEEIEDVRRFSKDIIEGMKAWEGEYEVFGGQRLVVEVDPVFLEKSSGKVFIIPMANELRSSVRELYGSFKNAELKKRLLSLLDYRRSAASSVLGWRVGLPKFIVVQSEDDTFSNHRELQDVVKHEFGHVLGLGDLYCSPDDSLEGVPNGTYPELDCYAIGDKYYYSVMCDHHGVVTNNDIEMLILAFKKNRMQLFQLQKPKWLFGKRISSALGRGN